MTGETFCIEGLINLDNGQSIKDFVFDNLPKDKLFIIEFVGINAFAQTDQVLFIALQVYTNSKKCIYPIVPTGSSPYSDSTFPARVFGSQQVLLYSDPNSDPILTVDRSTDNGKARVFVSLSGRLVTPQ